MAGTLDVERGDDLETVLKSLSQAIAWCGPRVDLARPKDCLRTAALAPHPLAGGRKAVVQDLVRNRHVELGSPPDQAAKDLAGGRLLVYVYDSNLFHGLEMVESRGYVDVNNTPPWDTWVAYIFEPKINYLVSWVPPAFIESVNAAISVNPEECILWIDEEDLVLRRELRGRGIL